MEQLIVFLTTTDGRIVCFALLGAGILDLVVPRVIFDRNIKKLEEKISTVMSPEKRQPIEKQIQNIQTIVRLTTFAGFTFIAVAVFGLTR